MIDVRGMLRSYGIVLCIYHTNGASATASSAALRARWPFLPIVGQFYRHPRVTRYIVETRVACRSRWEACRYEVRVDMLLN
jgi:hypothetical protein